ncbi:acyl-CoA dehydrogenase [Xylophilus sp. Kf1]|nr:acyl-CoA dehydrogenase [Xylophilus sp. Kf1]
MSSPNPRIPNEIHDWLAQNARQPADLAALIDAGLDRIPLPGNGDTLQRWQALAAVAAHDLSLVKLYEGHTDALAILAELHGPAPAPGSRWGTWCAEPPDARLAFIRQPDGSLRINGTKAWCSGAASVTHAVISGWDPAAEPCLAAVAMHQPAVSVTGEGWVAVGMAGSASVDVRFENAVGQPVGGPGDYTARPGFWQGGIGVAACWFGGAAGLARMTRAACAGTQDPHRLAHLGAIDVALAGAAALMREAAAAIDAAPAEAVPTLALRVRLAVESAAEAVLRHATRAVGAGPLCRDARFARMAADLPVYLRQSHAERDLAALGKTAVSPEPSPWIL